jgi:hypothetical protein
VAVTTTRFLIQKVGKGRERKGNIANLKDHTKHAWFSLVSLCLKAKAEMVPKTPSCYCMLLM